MEGQTEIRKILEEIRDIQREHLEEYRRVAQRSLDLQQNAVARADLIRGAYKRVTMIVGVIIFGLILLLAAILVRWAPLLFGR